MAECRAGQGFYRASTETLQIVGERLCETLDLRSGQRVLDVAAGNGNVSLAAARRFCEVVSSDYVSELLERGRQRAEADGLKSPALWGTQERLSELFGSEAKSIALNKEVYVWRYKSAEHWLDTWKEIYGPLNKAFAALDSEGQAALEGDLLALIAEFNTADDGTMVVPSDYVEVIVIKS